MSGLDDIRQRLAHVQEELAGAHFVFGHYKDLEDLDELADDVERLLAIAEAAQAFIAAKYENDVERGELRATLSAVEEPNP